MDEVFADNDMQNVALWKQFKSVSRLASSACVFPPRSTVVRMCSVLPKDGESDRDFLLRLAADILALKECLGRRVDEVELEKLLDRYLETKAGKHPDASGLRYELPPEPAAWRADEVWGAVGGRRLLFTGRCVP